MLTSRGPLGPLYGSAASKCCPEVVSTHPPTCSADPALLPLLLQQPFSPQGTRSRAAWDARLGRFTKQPSCFYFPLLHRSPFPPLQKPLPSSHSTYFLVEKETGSLKPTNISPSSLPALCPRLVWRVSLPTGQQGSWLPLPGSHSPSGTLGLSRLYGGPGLERARSTFRVGLGAGREDGELLRSRETGS